MTSQSSTVDEDITVIKRGVLRGVEAYKLLMQGEDAWNYFMEQNPETMVSFHGFDFSNSGATIDFSFFQFPKGVSFAGALFGNNRVSFEHAQFGSGDVSFENAVFGNSIISFNDANFGSGEVSFQRTGFGKGEVSFKQAKFGNGNISLIGAAFGDNKISFEQADFGDGRVSFQHVSFGNSSVLFHGAKLGNGVILFDETAQDDKFFLNRVKFSDEALWKKVTFVNNKGLAYSTIKTIAGHTHSSDQTAQEDTLNRQKLVDTLAKLLANPKNNHHQTIGLLGHWGVGKSTVLDLLKNALIDVKKEQQTEFLFAEFNAWEYEHTDNLQAGIAQEMVKALSSPEAGIGFFKKAYWYLCGKPCLISKFAWRLHGYKFLIPLSLFITALVPFWLPDSLKTNLFQGFFDMKPTGVTASLPYIWLVGFLYPALKNTKALFAGPLAKELLTYLKLPNYGKYLGTIPVMRGHIKTLTKARLKENQRLLYVVDDLDRCGHQGVVKVMGAVRMVLDIDNVIVVIAVDQRIALAALALNYQELATQHATQDPRLIARDYLTKIIHLPIVLTTPDEASINNYLNKIWQQSSNATPQDESINDAQQRFTNTPDTPTATEAEQAETTHSTQTSEIPQTADKQETNIEAQQPDFTSGVKEVEQLTDKQKAAFSYWIQYFELSNPRQIKRLNNTFNFLRNFYGEDEPHTDATLSGTESEYAFPKMVTLCALEYLNALDDLAKRDKLLNILRQNPKWSSEEELNGSKIKPHIIKFACLEIANTSMCRAIEPFVLPGVEVVEKV